MGYHFVDTIKPVTQEQAVSGGFYHEIRQEDTIADVAGFFMDYPNKGMFCRNKDGKSYLMDMRDKGVFGLYIPETGRLFEEIFDLNELLEFLFKHETYTNKERSGSNVSIFLDERNMQFYKGIAKQLEKYYGADKVEGTSISGVKCAECIHELINVANDIIDGSLLPNLFNDIPLKKDGTFQSNRKIVLYENGILKAEFVGRQLVGDGHFALCIVPQGSSDWEGYFTESEDVNPLRARLAIARIEGLKRIYPLLSRDLSTINDIKTKASYLKAEDIKVGGVYREKSGAEYLYLGYVHINDFSDDEALEKGRIVIADYYLKHYYLRVTSKVTKFLEQSTCLDEFLALWGRDKLKKQFDYLTFSEKEAPRKFVAEVSVPFGDTPYRSVNPMVVYGSDVKMLFTVPLRRYLPSEDDYSKTQFVDSSYAVFMYM